MGRIKVSASRSNFGQARRKDEPAFSQATGNSRDDPSRSPDANKRFLAGIGLSAIALALVIFYVWLSRPPKMPPAVRGEMLTPHDQLLGMSSVGDDSWIAGAFGLILYSSDGGHNWNVQETDTERTLTSVSFADNRHGFAVGAVGTILATTDGHTWAPQASGTANQLLSVKAVSSSQAFVVGAYGTLLATDDGGAHWKGVALPWDRLIPQLRKSDPRLQPNLNTIFFANSHVGWIAGEFGIVLKSSDGGKTWITQRSGDSMPQLCSIEFDGSNDGWAVGQSASVIHTSDGGEHWQEVHLPLKREGNLLAVALRGKEGVIVGDRAAFATKNGGETWSPLDEGAVGGWLSAVSLRGNRAVAVGEAAAIRWFNLPEPN